MAGSPAEPCGRHALVALLLGLLRHLRRPLRHLVLALLALLQDCNSLPLALAVSCFEARRFSSRGLVCCRRSKQHHLAMPCSPRPLRLARHHLCRLALALLCVSKRLRLCLRLSLLLRPQRTGLWDGRTGTGRVAGHGDGTGSRSRAGERDGTGNRSRLDLPLLSPGLNLPLLRPALPLLALALLRLSTRLSLALPLLTLAVL